MQAQVSVSEHLYAVLLRTLQRRLRGSEAFLLLDGGRHALDYVARKGWLHTCGFKKENFTHVLSVRARHQADINNLEVEAMLLITRWALRSCR